MPESHKTRGVELGKPEVLGVCVCGAPRSRKSQFCGDACRFWSKVRKGPGCWLWTASRTANGRYGQFTTFNVTTTQQRHWGAHVFAYALTYGPIPDGAFVLHSCDIPPCVRPDHLFLGDHKANMEDAAEKGRLHVPRPAGHKITVEDIATIRSRVTSGELRIRVAADYGISKGYVTRIMQGDARQYDAPLVPAQREKAS